MKDTIMPIKRTIIREKTTLDSIFPKIKEGGAAYIKEKYIDTGAILSNTTKYKNSADEVILFSDIATKKIIETVFKDYEQKDSYSRDEELRKFTPPRPLSAEFPINVELNQLINYGPILQANSGIIFSQTEVEI